MLADVPVQMDRLEQRLEACLHEGRQDHSGRMIRLPSWGRIGGIAAALIVALGATFAFLQTASTPVVAAPVVLAQLHRDLIAGGVPVVRVADVGEANRYLAGEWKDAPRVPAPAGAQVTSCCVRTVQDRNVACLVLQYRDRPVTMMVGHARELVCGAEHTTAHRHGRSYGVHRDEGLGMVMIEHQGRWICLMADLPIDDLMDLADSLQLAASR